MSSLALDIGGANLKAVSGTSRQPRAISEPFALWREPAALAARLQTIAAAMPPFQRVLLTTTAELCDCFTTKRQGIEHVIAAAQTLGQPLSIWSTAGRFVDADAARREPLKVAASNWHALATWVGQLEPRGDSLLIDIGSTTTDLIPLRDGRVIARGATDMARLAHSELVYLGAGRTPLMALGPRVALDGVEYHVMAEYFATTADAALLCGYRDEDAGDGQTADGRPMTRACAAARVLRMIGADLEMLDLAAATRLAQAFWHTALQRVAQAAAEASRDLRVQRVIVSGSGAALAQQALPGVPRVALAERIGAAGAAACAVALLALQESGA